MSLRDDFWGDGQINYSTDANSPPLNKREHYSVVELNQELMWGPTGYDIAFETGKKVSISTNPGLIAQQKYNGSTKKFDPIFLHGLSFEVLEYQGSGVSRKAKVRVKFNDFEIDRDVRWTGDIILPANVPLELKEGKTITLDKSGTPNRHTLTSAGDFIDRKSVV